MSKTTRNSCLLVLTALIWGVAFVAQSSGGNAVGPYTFNCIRNFLGAGALWAAMKPLDAMGLTRTGQMKNSEGKLDRRTLIIGGICCGLCLGIASNLQQVGIVIGDSVGKAGFLTACYIIIVPLLGLFLGKRCFWNVWVGVLMTLGGLYLLCMTDGFTLQASDLLLMACALVFSLHILTIDHFTPLVDGVRMSCIQFLVAGLISAVPMFLTEMRPWAGGMGDWLSALSVGAAWIPILYAGFCSSGIGYTLQIIGQEDVNPTIASLLMSLESVFSVIAGALLLGERMSMRELGGCVLIFAAVVLAQLPVEELRKKRS